MPVKSIIGVEVDVDLAEDLSRYFGLDYVKARKVARTLSCGEFYEKFEALETIVGNTVAEEVVRKGSFVDYYNGALEEYFALARKIAYHVK